MKISIFKHFGKIASVLLTVMILLSVCSAGVFAVGENVSATSKISVYVCDFENGSYGNVKDRANTGSIETDESGNSYFRFEAPTDSDTYRLEVYNSAAGELTLKEGNFYCVSVKYKVENISSAKISDIGTGINAVRHSDIDGKSEKIKGMTGVNYMPGDTTDWMIQSIVFKATWSGNGNANRLAINVTSPTCGSSTPESKSLVTVILMDDITVYECKGTTSALDFQVNGGSSCEPILAQAGEAITIPTPTRKLYDFGGWFADAGLTKPFASNTMPSGLVTRVYAKWVISDSSIAVNFDSTGGAAVEPLAGEAGAPISLPRTTRLGFNFGGWYNADFTQRYSATTFPSEDMTLYAKWEPISIFAGFENADKYDEPNNNTFTKRCNLSKDDKASGEHSLCYNYDQGGDSAYRAWAGVQLLNEYNEKFETTVGQTYRVSFKYKVVEVSKPGELGIILSVKEGIWVGGSGRECYDQKKLGDQWVTYDDSDVGKGWQEGSIAFTARHESENAGFVAIGISGVAKLYFDDFVLTPVDERFPASDKCMIAFETNTNEFIDSLYGDYGETFTLPEPEREGYQFVGWFTDTTFDNAFHEIEFGRKYTKLYADWLEIVPEPDEPDVDTDTHPDDESKGFDPMIIIIIVAAVVAVAVIVVVVLLFLKKNKKSANGDTKEAETESKEE